MIHNPSLKDVVALTANLELFPIIVPRVEEVPGAWYNTHGDGTRVELCRVPCC